MSYARRHGHNIEPAARCELNSKAVWNKLYVNFFLRRLNTSYKIKIADLRYGGQLVCREQWTTVEQNYKIHLVNVIELAVVGARSEWYVQNNWVPRDTVIGRAYCDGTVWLCDNWKRLFFSKTRRAVSYRESTVLHSLGQNKYRVRVFGLPALVAQMEEGQSFTDFMNQNWRV